MSQISTSAGEAGSELALANPDFWQDTQVVLGEGETLHAMNWFTGSRLETSGKMSELLADFPAAVLLTDG